MKTQELQTIEENLEEHDLRSEEVQDILTRVPNWMIRYGSVLFLALILLVLMLSWFIQYPDVVPSQAIVTTLLPPQKEYARTTGKLEAVLVQNGEEVQKGAPLAIIENSANYQDVLKLQSILDTLSISSDPFYFPKEAVNRPDLGPIEVAYTVFENNYLQYEINREYQPLNNELNARTFSVDALQNQLKTLEGQRTIARKELRFKQKEIKRYQTLFQRKSVSAQEYEAKELELLQMQRSFRDLSLRISQLTDALTTAGKEVTGTEINRTKEDVSLLNNVLQSYTALKKAIRDWQLQYVLTASIDGQVSFMNYWSAQQNVATGDLVFTIIPENNTQYIAKLKTPLANSGKVKAGQKVYIRLANYPDTEFGSLLGSVENRSALADKDGFYHLDVSLPNGLNTTYSKTIEFRQEMQGTAEIITEDLRLIERLFYQFRELMKRT